MISGRHEQGLPIGAQDNRVRPVLAATGYKHAVFSVIDESIAVGIGQAMQARFVTSIDDNVERIEGPQQSLSAAEFHR
jgi:hypothetical protein